MLARHLPVALLAAVAVLLSGCATGPNFGFPAPVTDDGQSILSLYRGAMWTGLAVAGLVWALVTWSIIRYRRRNDDLPSQTPENIPIEIFYTVTPLAIVLILFGFTVVTEQEVVELDPDPDVVVDVTGFQWSWRFEYPEEGVVIDPGAFERPELVLPVGSVVQFDLNTADVNHAFWVPQFLTKRDLIPRIDNALQVEVTEEGEWTGRCAEFCGVEHHSMLFEVRAVPADEYQDWLEDRRTGAGDDDDADDDLPDGIGVDEAADDDGDGGA